MRSCGASPRSTSLAWGRLERRDDSACAHRRRTTLPGAGAATHRLGITRAAGITNTRYPPLSQLLATDAKTYTAYSIVVQRFGSTGLF